MARVPERFPDHVRRRSRPRAGFTLIEVLIATVVLIIALLGAVGTIGAVNSLGGSNQESAIAYQAARSMLESIQAEDFNDVWARYNADPADDPEGAGSGPGTDFFVPGLNLQNADADGFVGLVLVPELDGLLREDMLDDRFGLPRDLSGDGIIDAFDHAGDHIVLPVRVRVEWSGKSGDRFVEFSTLLGRRSM